MATCIIIDQGRRGYILMGNSSKGATYRFLECTASQYMTPAVQTVTRQVTLRDLEALFERHDFNAFPVVEAGKVLGIVTKFFRNWARDRAYKYLNAVLAGNSPQQLRPNTSPDQLTGTG